MAVNLSLALKSSRMLATRDLCADGSLELLTSGDVLIVSFGLSATGGSVTNDVWTLAFDAATVAAVASGVAAKAQIKDSGNTAQITGLTVGTSATDVVVDNTNVASGQNVTMSSATHTHAP